MTELNHDQFDINETERAAEGTEDNSADKSWPKIIKCTGKAEVGLRQADGSISKSSIWAESNNFYRVQNICEKKKKRGRNRPGATERYLIIGFDSEFRTPDTAVTREELKAKQAKYTVLSYQVHCKLYDPAQPDASEWSGICYPVDGKRLSLTDLLTFAIWKGEQDNPGFKVPETIYLVGHFTRADIPAFDGFKNEMSGLMSAIRNTFIGNNMPVRFELGEQAADVKLVLRDTMLLAPEGAKSLKALGELVGVEKVLLSDDPAEEAYFKSHMDELLAEQPALFERYAVTDAVICVRYAEKMIDLAAEISGGRELPVTLTSIGIDRLIQFWERSGFDRLAILGKEKHLKRVWLKRLGYYKTVPVVVDRKEVHRHIPTATACYHGGRGEQFWFGPSQIADWTDYDLSSAYPTAMGLIRMPDWAGTYVCLDTEAFTAETLGVAEVDFEFPECVRFPTLPVRTNNGLIFPRKGSSDCAAPEIALALALGAKITVKHGVIVPCLNDTRVFREFTKDCIERRNADSNKKSLSNLFWKEICNSTYGKTAQGLHEKRVFDLRSGDTQPLPPSKITQPFFAAYITSAVRAVLGEIMNALPSSVSVFSCTTDGFLTDADPAEIGEAQRGPLCRLFAESRRSIVGGGDLQPVLEIKHQVRQLLGWRTRGQATLAPGSNPDTDESQNIVLAKGGIFTKEYLERLADRNEEIVNLFLGRTPDSRIDMHVKTGIRDMIQFDADLVEKQVSKRLNMEYDWKRKPAAVVYDLLYDHVAFSTDAWDTVDEFNQVRGFWESFAKKPGRCIKTVADYKAFADHVFTQSSLADNPEAARYLRRTQPDIRRLRQMLCSAWKHQLAGFAGYKVPLKAIQFAAILSECGVACSVDDVENGKRKTFVPKHVPDTPAVRAALAQLKGQFTTLDESQFVVTSDKVIDIVAAIATGNAFFGKGGER